MAKPKAQPVVNPDAWNRSHGTYITGAAHIDGVSAVAAEMERRWGCGRLRLLVGQDLREKFDRQRYLYDAAILNGKLEDVVYHSARMIRAWKALNAQAVGKELNPDVWETTMPDGTVVAIVQTSAEAHSVALKEGRRVVVYTLEEIANLLAHYRDVVATKLAYPGSEVTRISKDVQDPLDGIRYATDLDDPLDDLFHEGAYQ